MRLANQALGSRALSEIRRDIALRHSIQLPGSDPTLVLDLQFARDQAYVSRRGPLPTFTRASAAWRVNSAGVIVPAAINTPRLDYDPTTLTSRGLLLEEQRTNLGTYSSEITNAAWAKLSATATADQAVAPDGTTTGDLLAETTASAQHFAVTPSASIVSGTTYTQSVFLKKGNGATAPDWIHFGFSSGSFGIARAAFNVTTGVFGATTGIGSTSVVVYPNGWYRISITAAATVTGASGSALIGFTNNTNVSSPPSYAGLTTSNVFVWGAQFEAGASATSYIPTTTAAVIRSADVCSITGAAFSGFWNASEGTIALKLQKCNVVSVATSQANYVTANDGTLNNYILFAQRATGTVGEVFRVESGGTSQAILQAAASVVAANTRFGLAGVYKVNDVRASCNGGAVVSDITATMPALNQLQFVTVTSALWVESLQYFNRTKTNAELQALSAP